MLKRASTAAASSVVDPPPSFGAVLGIGPHLHGAALRARDGAPHEHQILVGAHTYDCQTPLGDASAAHPAGHAHAFEHPRRRRRRTNRARRAVAVRAVGLRTAVEVVPLDRALIALAL